MLNKEQQAAATDLNGTSIIVAGAGTGKTQTLIHKLVNLISSGVDPSRIALLTFTNDAADTMKARALSLGAKNIERLTACTYHSFCDRLMRQYNGIISRPNDYSIIEPSMVNDIVSMKLNDYKPDLKKQGIRPPTAKALAGLYSASINQHKSIDDLIDENPTFLKCCNGNPLLLPYLKQVIYDVREDIMEYKFQKNLKDFDDMLLGAKELLENDCVRGIVNNTYSYILIDEYQDTNYLQAEIVHLLRDTNPNLVVVGDDYQSIYRFRGAEVKNFTMFPSEFDDVHEHSLVQNYRSTQEILDLSNAVMAKHAHFGFQKTLVTGRNKHGVKPVIYFPRDQREESELVYSLIRKYKADDKQNGILDSKVAVLYRGSGSSAYLEAVLKKNDVPYEKHGGVAFFDMDPIQDVLSYLRVIANPFHELAWYRLLKLYGHIGDKRASEMAAMSQNIGFLSSIPHRFGNTKTARDINEDITHLENVLSIASGLETSHEMLEVVVDHYKSIYNRRAENNESMADAMDSVFEYLDVLLMLVDNPEYDDLHKWLDATTLREVDKPQGDGSIILSTVHSAKGLEWNHVIILDCVAGIFPRANDDAEMEEELRCFYVAMTRAADTLDIICPKVAVCFGKTEKMDITPFLKSIGVGLVDVVDKHVDKQISANNAFADKNQN